MFGIRRRRRSNIAARAGQHIFVFLNASQGWHYAIYQGGLSSGRHLVTVYVDGDWYPVAVYSEELFLEWHHEQ